MINTQREKIRLLEKAGLDHLVIIPFSLEFSKTSSVDFIRKILVGKLHASCVVVGFNHHFGHNREGNYEYLYELGKYYHFSVEEIPEQDIHNESVSSTKIRKALLEGNIQRANAYLDHEFFMIGPTQRDQTMEINGSREWFSIEPEEAEKQLPPSGIYAGSIIQGPEREKVVIRISGKDSSKKVRIHFLDDGIQAPPEVFLNFHKKIRTLDDDFESLENSQFREVVDEIGELIY
jgi:riboflavin kinase/FMN adenylyltransferase